MCSIEAFRTVGEIDLNSQTCGYDNPTCQRIVRETAWIFKQCMSLSGKFQHSRDYQSAALSAATDLLSGVECCQGEIHEKCPNYALAQSLANMTGDIVKH